MTSVIELCELHYDDAPAFFTAAFQPSAADGITYLGSGRGLSQQTAIESCLGEAIERAVAARPGTVELIQAHPPDLPGTAVNANEVCLFSSRQLAHGPHPGEQIDAPRWAAIRATIAECSCWCRADGSGAGLSRFVPATLTLLLDSLPICDSNGLAAGTTRPEAERAAVLELVERDAVAIWWYNRCPRPPVPLATLDTAGGAALRRWFERRDRQTHLLDLTHDLRIPVVAAISADPSGGNIAYGFAAKMHVAEAAVSATLEMMQCEISLRLAAQREALVGAAEGPAGRYLTWSRSAEFGRLPHLLPDPDAPRTGPGPPDADPVTVVAQRGPHPVLFVGLDQPDDPLRVVRAIVPGLRPWRPRFAPGRLFDVPQALGWPHTPIDETKVGDDVILI